MNINNLDTLVNNFIIERKKFIDIATKRVILTENSTPTNYTDKMKMLLHLEEQLLFSCPEYISNTFYMCDCISNICPIASLSMAQYAYDIPRKDKFSVTPTAIANTAILLELIYEKESERLNTLIKLANKPTNESITAIKQLSAISKIAFKHGSATSKHVIEKMNDDPYIISVFARYTLELWQNIHSFINSNTQLISFSAIELDSTKISEELYLNITDWKTFSSYTDEYYSSVIYEQNYSKNLTSIATNLFTNIYNTCFAKLKAKSNERLAQSCYLYSKQSSSHIIVSPSQNISIIPGESALEIPFMYCLSTLTATPKGHPLSKQDLANSDFTFSAVSSLIDDHFDINDNNEYQYNSSDESINQFINEIHNSTMDKKIQHFFDNIVDKFHFDVIKYLIAADRVTNIMLLNNTSPEYGSSGTILPDTITLTGISSSDCLSTFTLISPAIGVCDEIIINPVIIAYISELCSTPYPFESTSNLLNKINSFYAPEGIAYDSVISDNTSTNFCSILKANYLAELNKPNNQNSYLTDIWYSFMRDNHTRLNAFSGNKFLFFYERLLALMCTILNTSLPYLRNKPKAIANKSVSVITYPLGRLLDLLFTSIYITEDSSKKKEILATINECLESN